MKKMQYTKDRPILFFSYWKSEEAKRNTTARFCDFDYTQRKNGSNFIFVYKWGGKIKFRCIRKVVFESFLKVHSIRSYECLIYSIYVYVRVWVRWRDELQLNKLVTAAQRTYLIRYQRISNRSIHFIINAHSLTHSHNSELNLLNC